MKLKKAVCALTAGTMLFGSAAMAKENQYAYNKFVTTVLEPLSGYCDFAASFAGHESEYDDVNNYFTGLISAFYDDIDADFDKELVTVDSRGVTFYQAEEKGVTFLGSLNEDMIANFGDSYVNVFTVPVGKMQFIGVEKYGKVINEYKLYFYEVDPETDEVVKALEIKREDNEDGIEESVWAGGKTFYSYANFGGFATTMNPDSYTDSAAAAAAAVKAVAPECGLDETTLRTRMNGKIEGDDFRLNVAGIIPKTYIRATGLRFTDTPMVIFEDMTQLGELKAPVEIIPVFIDGMRMQFPYYLDPVIINDVTMVPMRTIFEALGADVDWHDENGVQTITASTDDTTVIFTIGSDKYYVNGEERTFDTPAQLMDDTTFVQLRAVSESFGCSVDWSDETRTVTIKSVVAEEPEVYEQEEQTAGESAVEEAQTGEPQEETSAEETEGGN